MWSHDSVKMGLIKRAVEHKSLIFKCFTQIILVSGLELEARSITCLSISLHFASFQQKGNSGSLMLKIMTENTKSVGQIDIC